MKKVIITSFSLLGIGCILYYTIQFYINQGLVFERSSILEWSILCLLIISCLVVGVISLFKLGKIEKQNNLLLDNNSELLKQNENLKQILLNMSKENTKYHFSELHELQNSQELSLDILNELSKE